MRTAASALVLAVVWLSPAALLGLGPLLLADGTRGLWAPAVLAGGALLAVLLLAQPWSRCTRPSPVTLRDLARHRWPSAGRALVPLGIGDLASMLLFVWAQLAALREIAQPLGWSVLAVLGAAAVVLALGELGPRLPGLGSALALVGLVLPLAAVQVATTPWWPRVWADVASRSKMVFAGHGAWATEGRPIRGVGHELTVAPMDEQRVTLLGRGRVRVHQWEGGESRRDVTADTELTLRPGDQLVMAQGFPLRFEAGGRIPGAPANGPDWIAPPGPRPDWRALVGLGVTLLIGAVGLSPVHAVLPAEPSTESRAARAGALLVVLGVALATLWALYGAWLTPEVYIAGVTGVEVYELPGSVAALGEWGRQLGLLGLTGLAAGGVVTVLAALRVVPRSLAAGPGGPRVPVVGTMAIASILAIVTPAGPWPVLLAAFALGASVGAPAAILGCWSERVTARGLAAGASLGLSLFGGLSIMGLSGLWGPVGGVSLDRISGGSWLGWLVAWPALVAAPLNALVAWLAWSRPTTSPRSPLPPGLASLHP